MFLQRRLARVQCGGDAAARDWPTRESRRAATSTCAPTLYAGSKYLRLNLNLDSPTQEFTLTIRGELLSKCRCTGIWAISWCVSPRSNRSHDAQPLTPLTQVQHAKRTQNLAHLPPYQTELVRAVAREVRDLDKDVASLLEPFQGSFDPSAEQATACTLLVNHLSMRRNKRCLLAYHRTRTDKLEELVWSGSDVLDLAAQQAGGGGGNGGPGADTAGSSSLSPQEEDYFRQYGDLLAAYKGQWTDIDLTGSLEPPRDLFIDVRVLKDAGEIQTEYG